MDLLVELGGREGVVHVVPVCQVLHAQVEKPWGGGGAGKRPRHTQWLGDSQDLRSLEVSTGLRGPILSCQSTRSRGRPWDPVRPTSRVQLPLSPRAHFTEPTT